MKKSKLGQNLIQSLKDVTKYEKGRKNLRTTTIEIPDPAPIWKKEEIQHIRKDVFHVSQPIFAAVLSVKPATIKAWEQGQKRPSGAANRLLQILSLQPKIIETLNRKRRKA